MNKFAYYKIKDIEFRALKSEKLETKIWNKKAKVLKEDSQNRHLCIREANLSFVNINIHRHSKSKYIFAFCFSKW